MKMVLNFAKIIRMKLLEERLKLKGNVIMWIVIVYLKKVLEKYLKIEGIFVNIVSIKYQIRKEKILV